MPSRLTPVDEALGLALSRMVPIRSTNILTSDALGMVLAAPVVSPGPVPVTAVALQSGLAVNAINVVGASAHSPVLLSEPPAQVSAGDALPNGFDAVLPFDAIVHIGRFFEVAEAASPGQAVRLAGHDLKADSVIAQRGTVITPMLQLVMAWAGIETVAVVRPRVTIARGLPSAMAWLGAELGALGCHIVSGDCMDKPHVLLDWAMDGTPRLACNPGDSGFVIAAPGGPTEITLPQRFDGLVAIVILLIWPVVETLTGRILPRLTRPIARKITSSVGLTEVVLLKSAEEGYVPLCVGEITLAALAAADAVAIVSPDSEGLPAGAPLVATPINRQFESRNIR